MRWTSCSLFVALCAALLAWSPVLAQSAKELTLQDALAQGLVSIEAISGTSNDGLDYGQPLALATIVSTSGTPLQLILPPGSQLQPIKDGPPLVALGLAQSPLTVAPQARLQVGIVAFSTSVGLHPTKANTYSLAGLTSNQQIITLLQAIKGDGGFIGPNLMHQRAIWQVATSADCAATDNAIQKVFGVMLGCQSTDAQNVATLIARSQALVQGSGSTSGPVTPTSISGGGADDSSKLLAIGGGVALLVGLIIAGLFLKNLFSSKVSSGQTNSTTSQGAGTPPRHASDPIPGGKSSRTPSPTVGASPLGNETFSDNRRRRSGGKTQPLDEASRVAPSSSPPVTEAPLDGVIMQSQSASTPQAQAKPVRRAAATSILTPPQPALPEPLRVPSLTLTGIAQGAEGPIRVLPFTLLSRSDVQQSEILAPDGTVSSPHCMIRFEEQGWTISDLASMNGTLVDGVPVTRRSTPLREAVIIQLGGVRLRFQGNPLGTSAALVQTEPVQQPQSVYRFNPNDQPYWLLTAKHLCTVEIANSAISVPHVLITFDDGWMVRDLNSSGGSSLNRASNGGQQAVRTLPQRILPGDQLMLSNQVAYQVQALAMPPVGAYQPLHWLGQGGAASVFLSHRTDDPSRAPLVVKLLTTTTDEARNALKREAELLTTFKGVANIVPFREVGSDIQLGPYLVFDYVEGTTLRSLLRSSASQRLSHGDIIAVAFAVCETLTALHQQKWVHCDVKPENILISRRGEVFLADFGSVTRMNEQPVTATSAYAPPEFRAQPYAPATAAADVYSLGAVLYEMVTGMRYHTPQAVDPNRQVFHQAITARLTATDGAKVPPLDSSNPLIAVIERCLQPMPNRISQIDALRDGIEQVRLALSGPPADLVALVKQVDPFL